MKLLVIEGIDGSGKSTQIKLLNDYLVNNGYACEFLHFPRTGAPFFGELISRFLRGEFGSVEKVDPYLVAIIYAGDRKDASDIIKDWLKRKKIVLLDRYTYSNIAYQCAKLDNIGEQENLRNWILRLEFDHFGIPRPDINFFLDVPFSFTEKKLLSGRAGSDREYLNGSRDIHEESLAFQKKVREMYLKVAETEDRISVIDCTGSDGLMLPPGQISSILLNKIIEKGII